MDGECGGGGRARRQSVLEGAAIRPAVGGTLDAWPTNDGRLAHITLALPFNSYTTSTARSGNGGTMHDEELERLIKALEEIERQYDHPPN